VATEHDDPELEEALAIVRDDDASTPGLLLAQRRIAGRLFGEAAPGLGRFRVLERLGGGGMGVVYAAYDPQLDRGVALKTVHVPEGSGEVALREAKALAKVSHPNIVPVFDVGFEAGHVYIVMELIRGDTLRAWVKGRAVPEILDAYRQAGLALAAAHDVGLVHRDFKPDNAIVGTDRRVRVVDFGLACEARTATRGPAGGTPAYMAPEQAEGAAVTPAADQYSFGVALREALPSPRQRWIDDAIERATAPEASARFGSMQELLRALGRDPARLRRRRIALAATGLALAAVGAGAFVAGQRESGTAASEPPCAGAEREIATSWEAEQVARIATLSTYGKTIAPQLADRLEHHRARWIANYRGACISHRIGVESDALLDRRMACLDRNRAALAQLAETTRDADAAALPKVVRAEAELPDPDSCGDVTALLAEVAPPPPAHAAEVAAVRRDLERARVLIAGGSPDKARELAGRAVAAARTTGYVPALAEALLVEGHARMADRDITEAVARLAEASRLAFENGMLSTGIEAWARRAWLAGMHAPQDPTLASGEVIEALATRATPFARALLHNNLGSVDLARGDRAAARAELAHSIEAARAVHGPGALELTAIRFTLAAATDDLVEKERVLREAAAEAAKLEGPDHPDTLRAIWIRLTAIPQDPATLAPQLAALCERDELHAGFATRTTECWVELAAVYDMIGDRDRALAAADRAVALGAERSDDTAEAVGYARLWRGDLDGAHAIFERALASLPNEAAEPWFRTYTRARLEVGVARSLPDARRDEAKALLERAIAKLTAIAEAHRVATIERQLARARAQLTAAGSPRTRSPRSPTAN